MSQSLCPLCPRQRPPVSFASRALPGARRRAALRLTIAVAIGAASVPGLSAAQSSPNVSATESAQVVPPALASVAAPLVLRGVTVIDVQTGRRLANRTVTIVGTRIQRIAPAGAGPLPRAARVVDARGKYLIPGFWDMHFNVMRAPQVAFPLMLANGVTGVLDRWNPMPLVTLKQWQREVVRGERAGPRTLVAGPGIHGDTTEGTRREIQQKGRLSADSSHLYVLTTAEARQVVDSLKAAGADWIFLYGPVPSLYWAAAAEARRQGLLFGGHAPEDTSLADATDGPAAADSGTSVLDHFAYLDHSGNVCGERDSTRLDVPRCTAAVRRLQRAGGYYVLTDVTYPLLSWRAFDYELKRRYLQVAPAECKEGAFFVEGSRQRAADSTRWQPVTLREWTAAIAREPYAGTSFDNHSAISARLLHPVTVLGSHTGPCDAGPPPGFSLPLGAITAAARYGFTPLQTLQILTLHPARALRATDSMGTVAAGKVADLLLLDHDPLEDIRHILDIRAVVANGRYYDRAALDGLLAAAERAAHPKP